MAKHTFTDSLFHDPFSLSKPSLVEEFLFESDPLPLDKDQAIELAEFFLNRGELRLLHGDITGLRYFDIASKLNPTNEKLFYKMGLALYDYASCPGKEKKLLKANRFFRMSIQLNPNYFNPYPALGHSLFLLGQATNEHHYFQKSKDVFTKALSLSKGQAPCDLAELYWNHALVWVEIGLKSGEALDLKVAMSSFEKAESYSEKLPIEFWQAYGKCAISLAKCVNDINLYHGGIHSLKNAVSISLSSFECWYDLGKALSDLYEMTLDDDLFTEANESLTTAAELAPGQVKLWEEWARLLSFSGRIFQDKKKLSAAIDKCKRGLLLKEASATLHYLWAESQTHLGELKEDLSLIYEGQNKLSEALSLYEDDPSLYLSYGRTLEAAARYFDDIDLYFQAIEKFQTGLAIDRTHHRLWYAMAHTYAICGKKEDCIEDLQLAEKFYRRALDLSLNALYHIELATTLSYLAELLDEEDRAAESVFHFEYAFSFQNNSIYQHPHWYFDYAQALDLLADYEGSDELFQKALDVLNHVLMVDPEYPRIHHRLALVLAHFAEVSSNEDFFLKSFHHYRLALRRQEEDDRLFLDWGVTCINFAHSLADSSDSALYYQAAHSKLVAAAKLGNSHAYYQLGCLYALQGNSDQAIRFIEKADTLDALPSFEQLQTDEWLDSLRDRARFINLLSTVESRDQINPKS
ncbi:MAG: hypothetical protein WDZ28_02620 [Simkaniaceae bacterium]